MATLLRIVSVPAGEAPLWVREKWVGLSLPLAQRGKSARRFPTGGVLSGPKSFLASLWALVRGKVAWESGFAVDAEAAVTALATRSPDAAAWWRANTPHLVRPGRQFIFKREAAEVYESDEPGRANA